VKAINKRQFVRKPSVIFDLKPGESLVIRDSDSEMIIQREAREKLSPAQIETQLRRIFARAPKIDCQAVLDDLRE